MKTLGSFIYIIDLHYFINIKANSYFATFEGEDFDSGKFGN